MVIRLPRLPVNWQEQPGLFERYWDESQTLVEKTFNSLLVIPAIQEALTELDTTIAAANTAIADTTAAAQALKAKDSLANSYPSGFTAPLISVASDGVVTIANHQRVYADSILNPTVSVTGGTVSTSAVAGDTVRIYYNDNARAGGSVSYYATIDPTAPLAQQGAIHSVGAGVVPDTGSVDGTRLGPPGYVYQ